MNEKSGPVFKEKAVNLAHIYSIFIILHNIMHKSFEKLVILIIQAFLYVVFKVLQGRITKYSLCFYFVAFHFCHHRIDNVHT